MLLTDFYASCVDSEELTFTQAKFALNHLSQKAPWTVAVKLLEQAAKKLSREELAALEAILEVDTSTNGLLIQINYYKDDKEKLKKIICNCSKKNLYKAVLEKGLAFDFLSLCWEENDPKLRYCLLKAIHNLGRNPPDEWFDWVLDEYFNPKVFSDTLIGFDWQLLQDWGVAPFLSCAFFQKNFYALSSVFINASIIAALSNEIVDDFMAFLKIKLADGFTTKSDLLLAAKGYIAASEIFSNSAECFAVLKLLIEKFENMGLKKERDYFKLLQVSNSMRDSNIEYTEKVIRCFSLLKSGDKFFDYLNELLCSEQLKNVDLNDSFYVNVFSHQHCPLFQVMSLEMIARLSKENLRVILKNKTHYDIIACIRVYWPVVSLRRIPTKSNPRLCQEHTSFKKLLSVLSESQREAICADLLKDSFRNIGCLVALDIISIKQLCTLKVENVPSYHDNAGYYIVRKLQSITADSFGDDLEKWELFSCLLETFSGTFKELLTAVNLVTVSK